MPVELLASEAGFGGEALIWLLVIALVIIVFAVILAVILVAAGAFAAGGFAWMLIRVPTSQNSRALSQSPLGLTGLVLMIAALGVGSLGLFSLASLTWQTGGITSSVIDLGDPPLDNDGLWSDAKTRFRDKVRVNSAVTITVGVIILIIALMLAGTSSLVISLAARKSKLAAGIK
jgi:hypothetical protein